MWHWNSSCFYSCRLASVCSCQDASTQECCGPRLLSGINVRGCFWFGTVLICLALFTSRWGQWERDVWISEQSAVLEARTPAPPTVSRCPFLACQGNQITALNIMAFENVFKCSRTHNLMAVLTSQLWQRAPPFGHYRLLLFDVNGAGIFLVSLL